VRRDEVDAMVRDIIIHFGLPFTVLSIDTSSVGWDIQLRVGGGRLIRFPVPDGRPSATRAVIQDQLEALT
jgi:hypothetical protein